MNNDAIPFPQCLKVGQQHSPDTRSKAVFYAQMAKLDAAATKAQLHFHPRNDAVTVSLNDDRNEAEIGLDIYISIRGALRERFPWALDRIDHVVAAQRPWIDAKRMAASPAFT